MHCLTYDLAIAKITYPIQSEEKTKFKNIFIALGAFHLGMALFHAYGQLIAEYGGPQY